MKRILVFSLVLIFVFSFSVIACAEDELKLCLNCGTFSFTSDTECSGCGYTLVSAEIYETLMKSVGSVDDSYDDSSDADVGYTYDKNGNRLTYRDSDGVEWKYYYTSSGKFDYKIGTIAYPDWHFGPSQKFSNGYTASPIVFDEPVEECMGFDITYEISEINYGNPDGEQIVYVLEPKVSSTYQDEGRFRCKEGEEVTYTVEFSKPKYVTSVCPRPLNAGNASWSSWANITNLRIRSTEY